MKPTRQHTVFLVNVVNRFFGGEKMKSLLGQKPPQQLLLYGALALVLYSQRIELIALWGLIYGFIVYRNWKKGSSCKL